MLAESAESMKNEKYYSLGYYYFVLFINQNYYYDFNCRLWLHSFWRTSEFCACYAAHRSVTQHRTYFSHDVMRSASNEWITVVRSRARALHEYINIHFHLHELKKKNGNGQLFAIDSMHTQLAGWYVYVNLMIAWTYRYGISSIRGSCA